MSLMDGSPRETCLSALVAHGHKGDDGETEGARKKGGPEIPERRRGSQRTESRERIAMKKKHYSAYQRKKNKLG